MMPVKALVRKAEYYDSVALMRVAKFLSEQEGVKDSAVVMATEENKRLLESAGLMTPEIRSALDTDLILSVCGDAVSILEGALAQAVLELKAKKRERNIDGASVSSLETALMQLPGANLVQISIAGRFAADEAQKALEAGLHVMLFSDNVPLEKEVELKRLAQAKGLLLMGPDCGTAIINGVPLAFANEVRRGSVGVVAAAGTGAQEVTTLVSKLGAGISQCIGTGGRDVKKEVGGITFLQGLDLLLEDSETKVLLLISKPPHESVLKKIIEKTKNSTKPIVATFIGSDPDLFKGSKLIAALTLEDGAQKAVALVSKQVVTELACELTDVKALAKQLKPAQKYLRGLYTGGTFVAEAQVLLSAAFQEVYSNAPVGAGRKLADSLKSVAHSVIDLGEDEFTVGRPHPMIDFTLRNKRILEEAAHADVGVLLMDLVLGWGANMNPLGEFLPTIVGAQEVARKQGRELCIVMSVTGTERDPQNRTQVVAALKEAGVIVCASNAAAIKLSIAILKAAGDK